MMINLGRPDETSNAPVGHDPLAKSAAGASWQGELGDVNADPAVMEFWLKTSPYHNLKPGVAYPEPFIFTTTKDDRVGPQHA